MQIHINARPMALAQPLTLDALLDTLNQPKAGIALAVNQKIIARSQWTHHTLTDGDEVTLITATAGG